MNTIGIDIGGTRIKAGLVNESGEILYRINEPSLVAVDYRQSVEHFKTIVQTLQNQAESNVTGVGLSVAGLMDRDCSRIIAAPNCHALPGHTLPADVSRVVGLPTVMDNDCNLMAIAEGGYGAAVNCRHYVAITLGTGVGGAIISDGVLIRGANGGGGELGHIPISIDGPVCGCGAIGCLEAYIGKEGTARYQRENHPHIADLGMIALNKLALGGDTAAIDIFRYVGEKLAVGLATAVNIFNPELLVIGGGVAEAGELLFEPCRAELKRRCFPSYYSDLQLIHAKLGNWAGVIGGAMIARKATSEINNPLIIN